MKNTLLSRGAGLALSALALLAANAAQAATLSPGDLIKISSRSDVYYYGPDAKRYVFPNEKTYFTWYSGFSTKTISDAELAAVQIGGAATYRPGVKMVKITTDPKVYAVARGGMLRWIETESIASQLYGADWATKVEDLPDAYFATYTLGPSISKPADFSPSTETTSASSIAIDRGLTAPTAPTTTEPTPTSTTETISLQISKTDVRAGDVIQLTASSTDPSGIVKIELFFDGDLLKTCTFSPCGGETPIPLSGTKPQYEAKAISTAVDGTMLTKIVNVPITAGSGISDLVKLSIGRSTIKVGQAAEAIVDTDASINIIRTDIYVNDASLRACASSIRQCRWSDTLPGSVGTVYDVYGKVVDNLGRTYETVHRTITIGTSDSPITTIASGKSTIYVNETIDVTVQASDDDGVAKIEIMKDGAVLKTCDSAAPCTLISGPWTTTGTLTFIGRATDTLGTVGTSEPITVTVTNP
jgi:hypothetical protein